MPPRWPMAPVEPAVRSSRSPATCPSVVAARGQDGADQPQDREHEADQAQNPVSLAEAEKGEGEYEHEVENGQRDGPARSRHGRVPLRLLIAGAERAQG